MRTSAIVAVAAGVAVVGVLAAKGMAMVTSSSAPAAFSGACNTSLAGAADWTVEEGKRLGKSVGLVQRAVVSLKIPAVCACTHEALQSSVRVERLALAGSLTGTSYKMTIALRAKDATVREHAREAAAADIERLTASQDVSTAEIGLMTRQVDSALKHCFSKYMGRG